MARAKKATMEPTPPTEVVPTEAVPTEQVEAAPIGLDLSADDLGVVTLCDPQASYEFHEVQAENVEAPDDTTEHSAPEMPVAPTIPEMAEEPASATTEDEAEPTETPPQPYEDKPETTNRCPYCNITLARVPPDMVNLETGRTYYRQSCPSCPYVERVDAETKRVYHIEWPIHK